MLLNVTSIPPPLTYTQLLSQGASVRCLDYHMYSINIWMNERMNSFPIGLCLQVWPLQPICQHAASLMILLKPSLIYLKSSWHLITYRIQSKLLSLEYKALHDPKPATHPLSNLASHRKPHTCRYTMIHTPRLNPTSELLLGPRSPEMFYILPCLSGFLQNTLYPILCLHGKCLHLLSRSLEMTHPQ